MYKRSNKQGVLVILLIWCAVAATLPKTTTAADADAKLINYKSDGLSYSFETDNGIKRRENVQVKNLDTPVIVFSGSYAYTDPKGVKVSVEYVADDKGYAPRVKIGEGRKELPPKTTTAPPQVYYAQEIPPEALESLIHTG